MRRVTALSTEQPYVTWALIGLNVIVYLVSISRPGGMINAPSATFLAKWGHFGPAVANGDWWRLITAAFLHASLLHIGLNMLVLSGSAGRSSATSDTRSTSGSTSCRASRDRRAR